MSWPKDHPNYMPSYDELYGDGSSEPKSNVVRIEKVRPPVAGGEFSPIDDGDDDDGDGRPRGKPRQADQLIELADERYELGCSTDGEPFAVDRAGPRVARLIRGSRDSLRADLAAHFMKITGRAPSAAALADALLVLDGRARGGDLQDLHLRVARHGDGLVIDLGTSDGQAVAITGAGWKVVESSPVLFRRTALTGALPVPERGGSLDDLRDLLNVNPGVWPLLVAWMVAAFLPEIPHPILALLGEQGTGKSTAGRLLGRTLDPSPAQLRTAPRDVETWVLSAAGSWVVVLDNLSDITPWLSDALCRAATGDGLVRRRLYTDGDLSVIAFRRVVALTSIDAGSLRGDLADRLLLVDLTRIDPSDRRLDADLEEKFLDVWPGIVGALLDLTAEVLNVLPTIRLERPPRMADFARVVAAVDQVMGTNAITTYTGQSERVANDVIESSPVASAICALMDKRTEWTGTAAELLDAITPDPAPRAKEWPKSPRGLAGALTRSGPALTEVGIEIVHHERTGTSRPLTISKRENPEPPSEQSQPSPDDGHDDGDGRSLTPRTEERGTR